MADTNRRQAAYNQLRTLLQTVKNHPTTPITYHEAVTFRERADAYMRKCKKAHDALLAICQDDDALNVQLLAFEPMEKAYTEVTARLVKIISDLFPVPAGGGNSGRGSGGPSLNNNLPPLELPIFDGNYANWPAFKDLFSATVDTNDQLAPSQKLIYLKSSLKGEPAKLIQALSTIDAHYSEAWNILKDRYNNNAEIVSSLINKLLNYKPVQHESAYDLQKLIDNAHECLSALRVLQQPVESWDSILVVLHVSKLDSSTKREWAIRLTGSSLPTFKEFTGFLNNHIRGLHATSTTTLTTKRPQHDRNIRVHHTSTAPTISCVICNGSHQYFNCSDFQSQSPANRLALVKRKNLCSNCLPSNHKTSDCNSKSSCRKCHQRHHTLLHDDTRTTSSNQPQRPVTSSQPQPSTSTLQTFHINDNSEVLLPTALCYVRDGNGSNQLCRVFFDQGSQGTLITDECVRRLHISRKYSCSFLTGAFFSNGGKTKGRVSLCVSSTQNTFITFIDAHITDKFTGNLPTSTIMRSNWPHLQGIPLADPAFHTPAPVDILLGAEYVALFKQGGKREGFPQDPVAEETTLGWILSGRVNTSSASIRVHTISLDNIIRRLWETEEPPMARIMTHKEKSCEKHFLTNFRRDPGGRFIVSIPFNEQKSSLGASREIAYRRLLQVERRLQRQPQHREQYINFMKEYESLGHMELLPSLSSEIIGKTNYLPHHFVVNSSSTTTKLRVVFDGSAKTTTGISLNDTLLVGPTVQNDIYHLLLRFRSYKFVLKADITKMFRQFFLPQEDADYHRILWRETPQHPVKDYRLCTVTYGTACAPFLSTRCIKQLAIEVKSEYPLAAKALHEDCYVDDLMIGAENVEVLTNLYEELTKASSTAQLQLRKWASNSTQLLNTVPPDQREMDPMSFDTDPEQTIKALGLQWNPITDMFTFKYVPLPAHKVLTKRTLLSDLSRMFDPLGLVSSVTVRAKLQLKELWRLNLDWDMQVPSDTERAWWDYQRNLEQISLLQIPRYVIPRISKLELHGFCDA